MSQQMTKPQNGGSWADGNTQTVNQSLGYAYIVPYKNEATFQVDYKGLIQLAQRKSLSQDSRCRSLCRRTQRL